MAELTVNKGDRYTVEPLFQWDINQILEIQGLSLSVDPEIHFTTEVLNGAIVRQATRDSSGIITVKIPNSLLQKPYKIDVFVCIYEGETFQSLYKMSIPVRARKRPYDYTLEDTDEEIYSFNELENKLYETQKSLTLTCENALLDLQKSGAENLKNVNTKVDKTLEIMSGLSMDSLAQLTKICDDAVATVNQKYDDSIAEFDRLGNATVTELIGKFDDRVESVRDEIMGDTGVMLEGKIKEVDVKLSSLVSTISTISIPVSSWSNKTYTISSDLIKTNSVIDIYYNTASKSIISDAEPSYTVSVGKIIINVNTIPAGTVTIDCIKVVNDV